MTTIKHKLGLTAFALLAATTWGVHAAPSIDPAQSQIKWTGYGVGKSHWGHVNVKNADLNFDKKGEPTRGEIVVDLTTIKTKDIEDPTYAGKLDGHLKNSDFFDVETFPTATFRAEKIAKQKDGSYKVDGKLKIKDIEDAKSLVMKPVTEAGTTFLVGSLKFDRAKHNVQYNSQKFFDVAKLGDKLIKDEIDLEIKLAVKP